MNSWLLLAIAGLIALTGLAHSVVGEQRLIGPLQAPPPDKRAAAILANAKARRVLRLGWHITTVSWLGMAALLGILVTLPPQAQAEAIVLTIGLTFLAMALVALFIARGWHVSWVLLMMTAAATLVVLYA